MRLTPLPHYFVLLSAILLSLGLSGCVLRPPIPATPITTEEIDGPPKETKDISQITDAVPKSEPLARYGNHTPYHVLGKTYHVMKSASGYREEGIGSWYGEKFSGRKTSSFEPYDPYAMTAAHKTLPLPTYVRVTNLENNKQIVVKVNDRGPFHDGRIIDLSYAGAAKLGYMAKGTAKVRVEVIETALPIRPTPTPTSTSTPPTTPLTSPSTDSLKVYLQVAAFTQLSAAQQLAERLASAIDATISINSDGSQQAPLHRVRVGPFIDETSAIRISEKIIAHNLGSPIVIHR